MTPEDEDLGPARWPSCERWKCQLALHRAIMRRGRRNRIIEALRARGIVADKLERLADRLKDRPEECSVWEQKLALGN